MSDIFYKYSDLEGAKKMLALRTLKFTRPSEMNDPYDVLIDDLFGNLQEYEEQTARVIVSAIITTPEIFAEKSETPLENILALRSKLHSMSVDEQADMLDDINKSGARETHPVTPRMRQRAEEMRRSVAEQFEDFGIFCTTRAKDNLLMWAHYADKHRGVVLGFSPNVEKDSCLTLLQPVVYSDKRPAFSPSMKDYFERSTDVTNEVLANDALQRLLYTKSPQWAYEEEWRLAIPDYVKSDNAFSLMKFLPEELCEIYLGCRMADAEKTLISCMAKDVNPNVQIFDIKLIKGKYALECVARED